MSALGKKSPVLPPDVLDLALHLSKSPSRQVHHVSGAPKVDYLG